METEKEHSIFDIEFIETSKGKLASKPYKRKKFKKFFSRDTILSAVFSNVFHLIAKTFFLIIFGIAFFLLYIRIGNYFYEIWLLPISALFMYVLSVYSILNSGRSTILKFFRIISSLLMLIIIAGLFLVVLIWFESLITLKLVLGGLVTYYTISIYTNLKSKSNYRSKIKFKTLAIISLICVSYSGATSLISLTPRIIEIKPKTEPEIIFWAGSSQLPDDPSNIDICKKYNIAFMPTIREKDVGNAEYMESYKNMIANGIKLHFAIGGKSEFFAHIDNAEEFPSIYRSIRQWFINESILDSQYIVSFSIDAEPPDDITDIIQEKELLETLDYGYNNYPEQKEIEETTYALREFKELIEEDGKECGMIQGSRFLDNADQDGDVSLFLRNVYSLPIKWDFKITMLYRTNRLQYDESDDELPEFLIKSVSIFYGALIEGTKFTTSELSFYQNVVLEENSEDNLAKEHYIFIGNFKKEFEDTRYIKDKQYFMDFDICRHFKNDRVFFYDLIGFLSHYGWEGIEELGRYAQQKDKSYLEYSTYKSLTFLTFYCGLIIIDIFASLEKDLT